MRRLTLILALLACHQSTAQNFNFDTLPQFKFQNVISLQGRFGSPAAGVYYSRNLWTGMGYRHYSDVSVGANLGRHSFSNLNTVPTFDFDIRLQHNLRLSLKRQLYFSVNLGYSPLIPLKTVETVLFDDYMNCGYAAIGLSGNVKRLSLGFYIGARVIERKQDLYYEIHTYAQFYPQVRVKVGYSFGERKEK